MLLELKLSGNFGLVLPRGSDNKFVEKYIINFIKSIPNLKAGRGDPCAGQVRAIADLSFFTNVKDLDSSENFGFVPPTVSII